MRSSFSRPSLHPWIVGAHASWRDAAHVDVGLTQTWDGETIGTRHRFHSAAVLQNLGAVIAGLEAMTAARSHEMPGLRNSLGERQRLTLRPLLSCQGMQVAGKKPNREVQCRGQSFKIPPAVDYR